MFILLRIDLQVGVIMLFCFLEGGDIVVTGGSTTIIGGKLLSF